MGHAISIGFARSHFIADRFFGVRYCTLGKKEPPENHNVDEKMTIVARPTGAITRVDCAISRYGSGPSRDKVVVRMAPGTALQGGNRLIRQVGRIAHCGISVRFVAG